MALLSSINAYTELRWEPMKMIGLTISFFIFYRLYLIVYNLIVSPLRSYPGPELWAASRLPWFYWSLKGQLHEQIERLHQQYGPVVRVAPDELSFTSSQAWKEIYGYRNPELPRPTNGRGHINGAKNGKSSLFSAERLHHGVWRRALANAFSDRALKDQEIYVQKYANLLVTRLREEASTDRPIDIMKWISFFSFDLIGALAFGKPFGCLEFSKSHAWVDMIGNGIKFVPWMQFCKYYYTYWLLPFIVPKELLVAQKTTRGFARATVEERINSTVDKKDLMSFMDKKDVLINFERGEIHNTMSGIISAGSDTTVTAVSALLFFLLRNPDKHRKLVSEIRQEFESDDDMTMLKVDQLKYLTACIQETLRRMPPAPAALPREVVDADTVIQGRVIPPGTAVGVHQWSAFNTEHNFRDAKAFVPERWLPSSWWPSQHYFEHDDKSAFQPFSLGPRACLGRNLAWAEMRLLTAKILFNFDLSLNEGQEGWNKQRVLLIWDRKPLRLRLSRVY